jgi:lipoyl(octanoyl) transferase
MTGLSSLVKAPAREDLASRSPVFSAGDPITWRIAPDPVPYDVAVRTMEEHVAGLAAGTHPEMIWLVEHPALYTAGTSADENDLVQPDRFPVYKTGRGGQYTYHGPGQRIAYVMLDLSKRGKDVRAFVASLESWIIATLDAFNVRGERREDRVGVWVQRPEKGLTPTGEPIEDKIAALGIRVRKWVSFHGISINVEPDLDHFTGIIPCGVADHGVTSLIDLGLPVEMADLDLALKASAAEIFGPIES